MPQTDPNNNLEPVDPVLAFWQEIVEGVREETAEEDLVEHDKFWNSVFDEYTARTKDNLPSEPS